MFCVEADYWFYLDKLRLACEKHGCDIHAYVLMTNHVHLLVTPQKEQSLRRDLTACVWTQCMWTRT
ncbi:transposase [Nitrosospira briensis]|uniref:transposase n=1 Tax=Nitrosospira briensis TaxID=35799 RepID=UPI0038B34628